VDSVAALEKLENIDSETDNLDITFVKMADSRYAKKWGVTKLPAMVYFRRRFPSIYRGKYRDRFAIGKYITLYFLQVICFRRMRCSNGYARIASVSRN